MITWEDYKKLKPLALKILYSIEVSKLPYWEEINKCGNIIKLLHERNNN